MEVISMQVIKSVKLLTLISVIAVAVSACSSSQDVETKVTTPVEVEVETVIEDVEEDVMSTVINNGVIDIPVLEDAQIFAEFTDALPAVINYFTHATEAQVIEFYQHAFGNAHSQERQRGRLTLRYLEGDEAMRVVISTQNKKRQVDVIIEQNNNY
jgi:hypothetical protein